MKQEDDIFIDRCVAVTDSAASRTGCYPVPLDRYANAVALRSIFATKIVYFYTKCGKYAVFA